MSERKKEGTQYMWQRQKAAQACIARTLEAALVKNQFLRTLEKELVTHTSTLLFDWIDHIEIGYSDALYKELVEGGFEEEGATSTYRIFRHHGAQVPTVVVKDTSHPFLTVAVTVESIADFLMVRGMSATIEGTVLSSYRRACVSKEQGVFVYVVERRGSLLMEPTLDRKEETSAILHAYERWQTRSRHGDTPEEEEREMQEALHMAQELVESVGIAMSASIVLDVERRYWQARNRAGQIQKCRQDALGMGWANHDHHTFRSSRHNFRHLVRLFEILGFSCRERFYAGLEAGWGAQVMEHRSARFVLFLDVDLAPDEIELDFAHLPFREQSHLGTIGLWCALHGESILKAGMHHLEAQFDFDKLREDLKTQGIEMMAPFTSLTYLRQAFSVGEMWPVAEKRIQKLLQDSLITKEQAIKFSEKGALGSHLENLERKEGFKGFNQKSVSDIIQRTDPRGETRGETRGA